MKAFRSVYFSIILIDSGGLRFFVNINLSLFRGIFKEYFQQSLALVPHIRCNYLISQSPIFANVCHDRLMFEVHFFWEIFTIFSRKRRKFKKERSYEITGGEVEIYSCLSPVVVFKSRIIIRRGMI